MYSKQMVFEKEVFCQILAAICVLVFLFGALFVVGGVVRASDAQQKTDTFEGPVTSLNEARIVLLIGNKTMTFQVVDSTMWCLDGTPVPKTQLRKVQFATVESVNKDGKKIAHKIDARSTPPQPDQP